MPLLFGSWELQQAFNIIVLETRGCSRASRLMFAGSYDNRFLDRCPRFDKCTESWHARWTDGESIESHDRSSHLHEATYVPCLLAPQLPCLPRSGSQTGKDRDHFRDDLLGRLSFALSDSSAPKKSRWSHQAVVIAVQKGLLSTTFASYSSSVASNRSEVGRFSRRRWSRHVQARGLTEACHHVIPTPLTHLGSGASPHLTPSHLNTFCRIGYISIMSTRRYLICEDALACMKQRSICKSEPLTLTSYRNSRSDNTCRV